MSNTESNAQSFLSLVLQDASLREQVLPLAVKKDLAAIAAIAAEKGFPCTEQELEAAYKDGNLSIPESLSSDDVTDEQLAHIAGGGTGYDRKSKGSSHLRLK